MHTFITFYQPEMTNASKVTVKPFKLLQNILLDFYINTCIRVCTYCMYSAHFYSNEYILSEKSFCFSQNTVNICLTKYFHSILEN